MPATDALWFEFFAMGSPCSLWLYADDDDNARQAAEAAVGEVRRIERAYSRYLRDSLLSEINRVAMAGGDISVDPETALLIDHAFCAHAVSDGVFDITSGRMREIWNDEIKTIPRDCDIASRLAYIGLEKVAWRRPRLSFSIPGMELDLGGIAKEYAADRAAAVCASAGSRHGLINLGGDISIIGPHPDGSPWRIGICDPFGRGEAIATLFVAEGGLATSGDYERYFEVEGRRFSHLIDPRTGWPAPGLPSVTVAAPSCLAAGTTSTIAILKGEAGPQWLRATGAAHLYVEETGELGGSIRLEGRPEITR
ncbi:MAG: FAD:protein FMN transferase [Methylocella sp.]